MIDTKTAAEDIGTDAKMLRRFLRSPQCPVQPVGSGSRYEFTRSDIELLRTGFAKWAQGKQARQPAMNRPPTKPAKTQEDRDRVVWEEEADTLAKKGQALTLPDIRNPRVRAAVKAEAHRREERLNTLLLARGMHITQVNQRRS